MIKLKKVSLLQTRYTHQGFCRIDTIRFDNILLIRRSCDTCNYANYWGSYVFGDTIKVVVKRDHYTDRWGMEINKIGIIY